MSDYKKIQQEIYAIVMDGADAPKPDGENQSTMLLWYEAQISSLIAEREKYVGQNLTGKIYLI